MEIPFLGYFEIGENISITFSGEICVYPVFFKFQLGSLGKLLSKKKVCVFSFPMEIQIFVTMACRLVGAEGRIISKPEVSLSFQDVASRIDFFWPLGRVIEIQKSTGGVVVALMALNPMKKRIQSHLMPDVACHFVGECYV